MLLNGEEPPASKGVPSTEIMNPKLNSFELGKTYQPQMPADHSPSDIERNYKETLVMETA